MSTPIVTSTFRQARLLSLRINGQPVWLALGMDGHLPVARHVGNWPNGLYVVRREGVQYESGPPESGFELVCL